MILDTGAILRTTTTDQDNRMLLDIVTYDFPFSSAELILSIATIPLHPSLILFPSSLSRGSKTHLHQEYTP